jgi:hypothetical protein
MRSGHVTAPRLAGTHVRALQANFSDLFCGMHNETSDSKPMTTTDLVQTLACHGEHGNNQAPCAGVRCSQTPLRKMAGGLKAEMEFLRSVWRRNSTMPALQAPWAGKSRSRWRDARNSAGQEDWPFL